ncbi:MAG: c-type cytochrome, partial [Chloroflexota bacterium]
LRLAHATADVSSSWLAPDEFLSAARDGRRQPAATAYLLDWARLKTAWRSLLPALALLAGVLALQLALTYLPYRPYPADEARLELVLRHHPGYPIAGLDGAADGGALSAAGAPVQADAVRLVLLVDGQVYEDRVLAAAGSGRGRQIRQYLYWALPAGERQVQVLLYDPAGAGQPQALFDDRMAFSAGQVNRLAYQDQVVGGDPEVGEQLYYDSSLGSTVSCRICHSLEPDQRLVGPSFAGVAGRAGQRVPGLSAEAYLRQSILEPDAYVVDGYPQGQMVQNLDEILTEQQIADLVAFLMTLK